MHECDAGAFGFDLRTNFSELGDRLAAKSSSKVAQENEEQRAIQRKGFDGFAGLRAKRLQ